MKEPIIVYENGSVDIFESVEKAELYIEPIDVKNNESVFYDSEGRLLKASVQEDQNGIERTVIEEDESHIIQTSELKSILKGYLSLLNYPQQELEEMELSQLVAESLKFKTE